MLPQNCASSQWHLYNFHIGQNNDAQLNDMYSSYCHTQTLTETGASEEKAQESFSESQEDASQPLVVPSLGFIKEKVQIP